jgi:hypothetical protein
LGLLDGLLGGFSLWAQSDTAVLFGLGKDELDPRQLQFALKIVF